LNRGVPTFSRALFGARLLKREALALMIKPGLDDYGYGVWSYETTGTTNLDELVAEIGKRVVAP
jgi:hypothetical protein